MTKSRPPNVKCGTHGTFRWEHHIACREDRGGCGRLHKLEELPDGRYRIPICPCGVELDEDHIAMVCPRCFDKYAPGGKPPELLH